MMVRLILVTRRSVRGTIAEAKIDIRLEYDTLQSLSCPVMPVGLRYPVTLATKEE